MKSIKLTDEQYEILVKLSFIGEYVLNAQHVNPQFKKEQEFTSYLYSHCEKFNLGEYFDKFDEEWEMNQETVFNILPMLEEFSDNDFWPILVSRLSERDALEKILNNENRNIEENLEIIMEESTEKYSNEFEQNGINNLIVRNVNNN